MVSPLRSWRSIINLSFNPSDGALGKHTEEPFQLPLEGGIVVNTAPPSIINLSFSPSDSALGKHAGGREIADKQTPYRPHLLV